MGILRKIHIRQGEEGWNCISWVKEALSIALDDGKTVGTSVIDWEKVPKGAMEFCRGKVKGRRFEVNGGFDMSTYLGFDGG